MKPLLETSLLAVNPKLAEEWHPTKNGDLTPADVSYGSAKKFWWLCNKCGNEWKTSANKRSAGRNCPVCAKKQQGLSLMKTKVKQTGSLCETNPSLINQWNYEKNDGMPENFTANSNRKVWWKCQDGHEWQARIATRAARGNGCPYCSGRYAIIGETDLATVNPKLAEEWHPTKNGDLTPSDMTWCSGQKVWWLGKCKHE